MSDTNGNYRHRNGRRRMNAPAEQQPRETYEVSRMMCPACRSNKLTYHASVYYFNRKKITEFTCVIADSDGITPAVVETPPVPEQGGSGVLMACQDCGVGVELVMWQDGPHVRIGAVAYKS